VAFCSSLVEDSSWMGCVESGGADPDSELLVVGVSFDVG